MKRSSILAVVLLVFGGLSGAGCQTLNSGTPADPENVVVPLSAEERARGFLEQGKALESRGDPVRALQRYRIALTLAPEQTEVRREIKRLEELLNRRSEEHYQAGLAFHEQGKYIQARHEFLAALLLRPSHPGASKKLVARKRIQINRYITHTLAPGDCLSRLAEIYYGDHRKFPVIARYNDIADVTKIRAGQKLRIPEIPGVPFQKGREQVRIEEKQLPEARLWEWGILETERHAPLDETAEAIENESRVAQCRERGLELLEEKKYREAVHAFEKVLQVFPDDQVSLDNLCEARFSLAERLLSRKDYLAAREAFLACLRVKGDCEKCHTSIRKAEGLYMEEHYRKGMQYFNQQKLDQAIREWELVQAMDPEYKRVRYHIQKSRKILSKLKDLKSKEPGKSP